MKRFSWIAALCFAACTPSSTSNGGGGFPDDDAATGDAPVVTDGASGDGSATDATPTDNGATDAGVDGATTDGATTDGATTDGATTDVPQTTISWGARCNRASDLCAAPSGERGSCSTTRGTPLCVHTCDAQPAMSMCEGDRGVCVSGNDGHRYCLPKCGDAAQVACGAGSACAWLGYRAGAGDGGLNPIGVCISNCAASGVDACQGAGVSCNPTTRSCEPADCGGMCPLGTTCSNGVCNPPTPSSLYGACNPMTGATAVCSQNYCLGDGTTTAGFCTQACDSATGSSACGIGACYFGLNVSDSPAGAAVTGYWESSFNVIGGRLSGVCTRPCSTNADCPGRFTCQNYNGVRVCMPYALTEIAPAPGAGLPGALCRGNSDCATNNCLLIAGYRDGICARASLTTPCPAGTTVLSTATGPSLACTRSCSGTRDDECGGSWRCTTAGQCANVACRANSDCTAGYTCDVASNRCVTSTPTGLGDTGSACSSDATCRGVLCLQPSTSGGTTTWNGGYCSTPCTGLSGGGDTCPAGSYCSARTVGTLGACLKLCDAAPGSTRFGACRAGYTCRAFLGDARVGLCLD